MSKHFLYLTNDKLIALIWRAGAVVERDVFGAAEADSAEFLQYLSRHRETPTFLVTDLIEEDFRTDTVPHLRGGDQEAVVGRKLSQLYRATMFRHAVIQGRESEGRRDDRVLYHAVTNPDLLKPWLAALDQAEVPLEGIYSSAVLSGRLPEALNVFFTHTLLVTIVPDFGLRQTYFRNKQVKFSRLTPIIYDEGQSVGTLIAAETSRTWQYLDSLRYFSGDDTLEVCILVHARDRDMIAEAIRTYPLLKYRFLDIDEVAARIRLKPAPTSSHAEEVLVHLYAQGRIENHFADREQTRHAVLRRTRIGLYALTACVLLAGAGGAGFNLYQAARVSAEIDRRNPELRAMQSEFQSISAAMLGQRTASDTVRDASAFFSAQMRPVPPAPGDLLRELSAAWSEFPVMRLLQVVWAPNQDAAYMPPYEPATPPAVLRLRSDTRPVAPGILNTVAAATQTAGQTAASLNPNPPLPGRRYEIAVIEGTVTGFRGDYRAALADIDRLVQRLNRIEGVTASVVSLPVNLGTASHLHAEWSSAEGGEAKFTLKVLRDNEKLPLAARPGGAA